MWFILALAVMLCWGAADLFYKKGTDPDDRYSHLKTAISVGLAMGVVSFVLIAFSGFSFINLLKYTPASLCYIISMVIGYAGLRYLEVSVISPVQNSSGALCAILFLIFLKEPMDALTAAGTVIICIGVILLAAAEKKLSTDSENVGKKYRTGAAALAFPLLYCLFDTFGTFADGMILEGSNAVAMSEIEVLIAYGITFFIIGVFCFLYLAIFKKCIFNPFRDRDKLIASCFEEGGQLFYVYAMAAKPAVAAPMIAAYCVVSVILSRIFLKEKLSRNQYFTVYLIIIGIVLLGIAEGLSEL